MQCNEAMVIILMIMKKFLLIYLFAFCVITSQAQYVMVDTLKLNKAERALAKDNSLKNQKAFFDAFPKDWPQYITTYQYLEVKGFDKTMYDKADTQLATFAKKLTLIDDSTYCARLVNLAIGAELDADAPNYLQELQHDVMRRKTGTMLKIISQLIEGDQMLYWQFYWSSLFCKPYIEAEYNKLYDQLKDKYPSEMKIMSIAFEYFCGKSFFMTDGHIDGKTFEVEK